MAEYGIKVINTTGQVQIDSNYRNLQLLLEDSASTDVGVLGAVVNTGLGSALGEYECPLIGIKADATSYNSHFTVLCDDWGDVYADKFRVWPEDDMTTYYTVWGRGVIGGENYGFAVFDASGDMVFDATMDWMRIVGVYTGSAAYGVSSDETVNDAVNNYFYLTNPCYDRSNSGGYEYTRRRGFKRTSSTNIRIGTYLYNTKVGETSDDRFWVNDYTLIEIEAPD